MRGYELESRDVQPPVFQSFKIWDSPSSNGSGSDKRAPARVTSFQRAWKTDLRPREKTRLQPPFSVQNCRPVKRWQNWQNKSPMLLLTQFFVLDRERTVLNHQKDRHLCWPVHHVRRVERLLWGPSRFQVRGYCLEFEQSHSASQRVHARRIVEWAAGKCGQTVENVWPYQ